MNGKARPILIGAFLVGALALLFVGLLFLGAGFWGEKERYVIYFRESVNGLNRGAPVKMRGVQIGRVSDILIQFHPKRRTLLTRVEVEIDLDRLQSQEEGLLPWKRVTIQELIDLGLRAQLKLQSFVTGLLYVDLDFYPERPAVYVGSEDRLEEIPAIPSSQEEIESTIQEVIRRIQQIPFEEIAADLKETLEHLNRTAAHLEKLLSKTALQKLPRRIDRLIAHLDETTLALHRELEGVTGLLDDNLKISREVLRNVNRRLERIDPLLKRAEEAIGAAERSFTQIDRLLDPDSELLLQLVEAIDEVERAARSLRHLAETLQEHPESLIRGRAP